MNELSNSASPQTDDAKTVSQKQLDANRNNAQKSTGPKTEEGKAVSKMNAVKHGILSKQVVLQGMWAKEDAAEFEALREEFWQSCAPVGAAEAMLVEEIVTCCWRLRRVLTAENGEIMLSVDNRCWERAKSMNRKPLKDDFPYIHCEDNILQHTVEGIDRITEVLERVRENVKKMGELTQATVTGVREAYGAEFKYVAEALKAFLNMFRKNPEGLEASALKAKHQQLVLDYLEKELKKYQEHRAYLEKRAEKEEDARFAASFLPSSEVLEKIMRYETTLHRQLDRAMNQLKQLQQMRKEKAVQPPVSQREGRACSPNTPVPPPLTMEVSQAN